MKKPNLTKWDYKPELEGVLLFAQLVEEMLFNYTLDSYRVSALNSLIAAYETATVAREVENGVLKKGAMQPVCDELSWQIENDLVADIVLGVAAKTHAIALKSGRCSVREIITRANYIADKLRKRYYETLSDVIIAAVRRPKKKRNIVRLARLFVTDVLGRGFSQEYVYAQTRGFFFSGDRPRRIVEVSQISDFFKRFANNTREWLVVYKGSGKWKVFKGGAIGDDVKIFSNYSKKVPVKHRSAAFLKTSKQWSRFIEVRVQAKDEESARKAAHDEISQYVGLVRFFSHNIKLNIHSKALVINPKTKKVMFLKQPIKPVMRRPDRAWSNLPDIFQVSKNILAPQNIAFPDIDKIYSSLELHSAAVVAERTEEQLLNLWTSLESLVPKEQDADSIVSIVEAVTPFIMLPYTERLVHHIYRDLKDGGHSEVTDVIDRHDVGSSSIEQTAAILAIHGEPNKLEQMMSLLKNNPLARTRLYHLGKGMSDVSRIKRMAKAHEQRIRWQLRRIYRTRNMVIHTGKALPYLDIIVENLHYYLDLVHHGLARILANITREVTLMHVFDEARYSMEIWRHILDRNVGNEITKDNYLSIVLGPFYAVRSYNE